VIATSAASFKGMFAMATNSYKQTNKAAQYVPLISISFLDVYGFNLGLNSQTFFICNLLLNTIFTFFMDLVLKRVF
jgi:hypothetical protein